MTNKPNRGKNRRYLGEKVEPRGGPAEEEKADVLHANNGIGAGEKNIERLTFWCREICKHNTNPTKWPQFVYFHSPL